MSGFREKARKVFPCYDLIPRSTEEEKQKSKEKAKLKDIHLHERMFVRVIERGGNGPMIWLFIYVSPWICCFMTLCV